MKNKEYVVLLIDDHPLITSAYKSALDYISKHNDTISFSINVAHDCDTANEKINQFSSSKKNLDIVFLDIRLPPSKDGKIVSGEDLGLKISKLLPFSKIIVSTTLNDNYRVRNIFKSINPIGFLTKNDINPESLVMAINSIIVNSPYYSKTILKLLRKEVSNDLSLDAIDRKLLYELSIGTMMKDLPEVLSLSLPALEKRKKRIKQIFNTESPYDKEMLQKAREKGFI